MEDLYLTLKPGDFEDGDIIRWSGTDLVDDGLYRVHKVTETTATIRAVGETEIQRPVKQKKNALPYYRQRQRW